MESPVSITENDLRSQVGSLIDDSIEKTRDWSTLREGEIVGNVHTVVHVSLRFYVQRLQRMTPSLDEKSFRSLLKRTRYGTSIVLKS